MRLIDLRIDGFGKLNNVWIGFSEGTNLVSGSNEAGKSTLYACIRAMFFGMTRARGVAALKDTYSHYKPWFAKNYGATMRVEHNGHIYSIKRDFLKDPVGCTVYDDTAMEAVPYADRFVAELLLNMSEDTYDNTISINKLRADGGGSLSGALKSYIVNMDTTGSHALNCTRARAYLNDQKNHLLEGISPEAAKEYAVNCSEIKRLEKEIRDAEAVTRVMPAAVTDLVAAEAAEIAELEAVKAEDDAVSLDTEIQCLDAEIIAAREILRDHSIYSSKQIAEEQKQFLEELDKYEKKAGKKSAGLFRALYIVFFILTVLDVVALAYTIGSNYPRTATTCCIAAGILLLALAITFLSLCIISKNKKTKLDKAFGKLLEHYTGYDEVTPERIEKVRDKLEELKELAAEVEKKEVRLAELSIQAREEAAKEKERAAELEAMKAKAAARAEEMEVEAAKAAEKAKAAETTASAGVLINEAISRINEIKASNVGLKELLRKNDAINEEVDAIDMALEKLDELADTMKDSLGVHLNASASQYISAITKGAYDSLSIDDDLNVFMNTKDRMVPIDQVSNGTSDQIYMALRMAGARLVQNGEDKLPIIFDDSFVNYDDERLEATLSWLVKEYRGQIIIFSCQGREAAMLTENGLTFNPIHL